MSVRMPSAGASELRLGPFVPYYDQNDPASADTGVAATARCSNRAHRHELVMMTKTGIHVTPALTDVVVAAEAP